MSEEEKIFQLALVQLPGIGPVNGKKILAHFGSAKELFSEKDILLKKMPGLKKLSIQEIIKTKTKVLALAEKEFNYIQKNNIQLLCFQQSEYPQRLKHCDDAPLVLFKKGFANVNMPKILAIVGTRNITNYGKIQCEKIVRELSSYNDLLIVSGLAMGVDVCAHRTSLENSIPTLGVLGHGFSTIYPNSHREIAQKMTSEKGGLITEFFSDTGPDKENFPKRNRIVAGMTDALLVVESNIKGGAMITAYIADSYNRDVMALPGPIDATYSSGCNFLIKTQKAILVENAQDIEKNLGWKPKSLNSQPLQAKLFNDLSAEESLIVEVLKKHQSLKIDSIALHTQLKMSDVSVNLLNLEFKFIVKSLPGKMYTLI